MLDIDETISSQPDDTDSGEVQPEIEESSPSDEEVEAPESEDDSQEKTKNPWVRRVFYGLGIFLLIVALGAAGGALTGTNDRVSYQDEVVGTAIADQFVRGLIDMENGNYEIAIDRFKYILTFDPDHVGARDQLTKALLEMGAAGAIPTPVPTSTSPATPDFRGEEDLFNQALAYRDTQEWDRLINTLDSLRKTNAEYKAVEVDGLYYLAFRNRGIHRIQVEGNLEGGIFDFNRAELFGPIDIEASNYRQWSEWYLTGVSFWDLDWEQAVQYFGMVAPSAPNLSDSSFFTASARLATAQVNYGAYMLDRGRLLFGNGRYCDAFDLFKAAQQYVLLTEGDQEKSQQAEWQCFGFPPTETPPPEPTEPPATP